jgi:hypothetical protein
MRQIKFRGKGIAKGEWAYGYYVISNGHLIHEGSHGGIWTVKAETVGQYTEQKDINGNEIYEGMCVRQVNVLVGTKHRDFTGEVKFYDGTWWIDNGADAVELFSKTCQNTIITG